jgi:hypothetical protein
MSGLNSVIHRTSLFQLSQTSWLRASQTWTRLCKLLGNDIRVFIFYFSGRTIEKKKPTLTLTIYHF